MTWRERAADWLARFMRVNDYATFDEALKAQGIHCDNPVGVSDSISLKLTKGDEAKSDAEPSAACEWRPGDAPSDINANH